MTSINCALMASKIPIMLSISFSRRKRVTGLRAAGYYTFKRGLVFSSLRRRTPCASEYCTKRCAMEAWKSKDEGGRMKDKQSGQPCAFHPSSFRLHPCSSSPERVEQEHCQPAGHINQTVVDRRGARRDEALMVFVRERVDDDKSESDEEPATT